MHRARGPLLLWLLIAASVVLNSVIAEDQNIELKQTDSELNVLYQQLMNSLSAGSRERLRMAERAWILFGGKNEVALRATSDKRGLSPSELAQLRIAETRARCDQLRRMLSADASDKAGVRGVQSADTELNNVYKQAIALLSPAEKLACGRRNERGSIFITQAVLPVPTSL